MFCMVLGTNNKFCLPEHQKIVSYNKGGECLLRGTYRVRM